ncbi:MAG TPA: ATP-binding protein [Bdellovibrionota bacterium]|jgi:two-component system sensor histidine kinase KdpD|nr:ATP-binding protein [Bdellovibrionota bacterium]
MAPFGDERPDPDVLMAALRDRATRETRGKLKIYLGMSAGVGKTFAMLKGAHELRRAGRHPVIGVIETHGRRETQELLEGLELMPRHVGTHQGIRLEEFDLDAALAMHPDILLVDELAHTNAPGSRHTKRWQDVLELLGHGIEVHTTLNVQHLESRADSVETMTGIRVTETVPDSVLDFAQEIVVIDLDPHALVERLRSGKIYPADRIATAESNFFRPENLTALREIALRVTADRVDQDLQTIHRIQHPDRPWRASERLLVAIYASPFSELMIRRTRLLAATLDAPWYAAYVESGRPLSEDEKKLLAENLALVRELGGEVLTTLDSDPAQGLLRLCRDYNITQIVVGKSRRRWLDRIFGRSPTEQILTRMHPFDIYVVAGERRPGPLDFPKARGKLPVPMHSRRGIKFELATAATFIFLTALVCRALGSNLDYRSLGILFLVPILVLSLYARPLVIWLSALLAALTWDFWFIVPYHSFTIAETDDYLVLALFVVVAVVTGVLTGKLRRQRGMLELREARALALYRLSKALSVAVTVEEILGVAQAELREVLGETVLLYAKNSDGATLSPPPSLPSKEVAVAEWVLKNNKTAGKFSDTLPAAEGRYHPLGGSDTAWGVLAIYPARRRQAPEVEILVESMCSQVGICLQKERLRHSARLAEIAQESDRLARNLLNVVSHELKTPITAIMSSAAALASRHVSADERERQLFENIDSNGRRLTHIVDHLLEANRLDSGKIDVKREPIDLSDIVAVTLRRLTPETREHIIEVREPAFETIILSDEVLVSTILKNLVHNAILHTPEGTKIVISLLLEPEWLRVSVRDFGPGLVDVDESRIFEKFYRGTRARPGGTGLGLSLARGLAEALGGTLTASNHAPEGVEFCLRLPRELP